MTYREFLESKMVIAPERDLEALRSKVDFWETVCAEIGAGSDVEE